MTAADIATHPLTDIVDALGSIAAEILDTDPREWDNPTHQQLAAARALTARAELQQALAEMHENVHLLKKDN